MNPKKIPRTATGAKFGRIIWQALYRMLPKSVEQLILYIAEMQSRKTENPFRDNSYHIWPTYDNYYIV